MPAAAGVSISITFLLRPDRAADGVLSDCLSVREHISGTTCPIVTKFFTHVTYICGSVLLWRRCDMLCTFGFMDGDMFVPDMELGHNL